MKIRIVPSWAGALRVYLAVLVNPKAGAKAHASAVAELDRMAELADLYVKHVEEKQKKGKVVR